MTTWEPRLKRLFGSTYPLARHLAEITLLFLVLLVCLFVVRHAVPRFFAPSETLGRVLHVVDAYAALLGIVGYAIWITLDMVAIVVQRARVFAKTFRKDDRP